MLPLKSVSLIFAIYSLQPVSDNLFLFPDAANVYVIRKADKAILVDFGSGRVLDALPSIGVRKVEAIYLTHRDRDQWFGFEAARTHGIPIHATPAPVRDYWRRFFPAPDSRVIYSAITRETDYPTTDVAGGAVLASSVATLRAIATPGHTGDHIAYTATIDGRKVAFSGDAIYSRGKVWQGFQLDWDHWRGHGYEAAAQSLLKLRDQNPALLAPSHGEPIREGIEETLAITAGRLWRAAELKNFDLYALTTQPPLTASKPLPRLETARIGSLKLERLSPHLWMVGNNYFLVADDGSSLAVDNNLDPALWKPILQRIGAKTVDYLWFTHLHVDHVFRLPEIKAAYRPLMVTIEPLADLLQHPTAYWHPYANFDGIQPDRVLHDGEEFTWKRHRFRAYHAPGQTWFHAFLETAIDGHRAVFSGDSFQGVYLWDIANGTGGWSGFNRGFPLYHAQSASLMLKLRPDWVLAEHGLPFEFREQEWKRRVEWAGQTARLLDDLSPSGRHLYDFNPHVFSVYPLISPLAARELRVMNPFDEPLEVSWSSPGSGALRVPPHATASAPLHGGVCQGRCVVPVEITARGRYLGQAAFFIIDAR